ncbi:uncharacterized protein LOC110101805 [Dendrobium catenatum]|uniref:uncharacterized protein LOC110101805 n=1 Tax=Dendrobium catenatum TaxID=906689 RepID=UPI0009F40F15|nr:uncharacterized protein LOC110101805 [Dendrobium catenatum]
MEPPSLSDFPPLAGHAGASSSSAPARVWKHIVVDSVPISKDLPLSFLPLEPEIIPFAGERLVKGAENWNLCLVGYSIGRRPYYEALLGAIKKTWSLKGSMQLLSLSDGFFLLRFSTSEDYEMAWSKGVWFFLGRPFLLQKWSPKFRPKRENFTSIPIWVKILDLPLVCWNSEGISRIASKIGIPLAVDALTAQKTRLTFARVCIQVDASATFPEEIPISIEEDVFSLKIQYEWKPTICEHCKSLVHPSSACPTKPTEQPKNIPSNALPPPSFRGRSKSRRPQGRNVSSSSTIPPSIIPPSIILSENFTAVAQPSKEAVEPPKAQSNSVVHTSSNPVIDTPISITLPPPGSDIPLAEPQLPHIPNLNSPQEETSSSTSPQLQSNKNPVTKIHSPNKFDALKSLVEDNENCTEDASLDTDASTRAKEKDKAILQSGKQSKNVKGKQAKKGSSTNR